MLSRVKLAPGNFRRFLPRSTDKANHFYSEFPRPSTQRGGSYPPFWGISGPGVVHLFVEEDSDPTEIAPEYGESPSLVPVSCDP